MYNLYIMASDPEKTELLFKEFVGVVNVRQNDPFNSGDHKYPFRSYVTNESIFSNNIPADLSNITYTSFGQTLYGSTALDASFANSGAVLGISYEIPGTDLVFYYKAEMTQPSPNTNKTWYIDDGDGLFNSLMKDSIPFLYDATQKKSYLQTLWSNSGTNSLDVYESPLFWLMDYQSGFIEMYGDQQDVTDWITINGTPRLSFIKYNGPKGASGGGGGGGDASFNNLDVSNNLIVNNTQFLQKLGPQQLSLSSGVNYYKIANVIMSTDPSVGSGPTVCSGRFTIKIENDTITTIEFIAGFYSDDFTLPSTPSTVKPFIKVIYSNGEDIIQNSINYIGIGLNTSGGTPLESTIDLLIGITGSGIIANNSVVRLYQNNEGTTSNTGDYRDWTLESSFIAIPTLVFTTSYTIYKQLKLDTFNDISYATGTSLAMSSLDSETFMGNVNVGEKITVLNGLDISGQINMLNPSTIINGNTIDFSGAIKVRELGTFDNSLNVNGFTTLKDVFTQNITTKPFATIDNSLGHVKTYQLSTEFLYPANVFYPNTIRIQKADLKFDNAAGIGGHIIDLSAITSDGDNLLLNGGLEFNNASDISNTIVNLNSIYPSEISGNDILNIYGDLDMSNNDIINVNRIKATIIEANNQSIDISGNLDMNNNDILNTTKVETDNIETNNSSKLNILSDISMANTDIYLNNRDIINVEKMDVSYINIRGTNSSSSNIYGTGNGTLQWDPSSLFIGNINDNIIRSIIGSSYVLGDSVYLSNGSSKSNVTSSSNNYIGVLDNSGIDIVAKTGKEVFIKSGTGSKTTFSVGTSSVLDLYSTYNEDKVGHKFYIPGADLSAIVIGGNVPTGTEYILKNIGSTATDEDSPTNTQAVELQAPIYWLENGWNDASKYSKERIIMGSELKFDIFNAYLTANWPSASSFGAFPLYTNSDTFFRIWDSSYGSPANGVIASLGVMTALYRRTNSSSELIPADYSQKVTMPRDGWLTGVNIDVPFGVNKLSDILDVSGTAVLQIITNGLGKFDNGTSLQTMEHIVLDTVTQTNIIDGKIDNGWNISLEPKKWVFIPKGRDLSQSLKLRMRPNSDTTLGAPFTSANCAKVRYGSIADSGSYSTSWSQSAVQGYMTVWCPPREGIPYKNY